MISKNLSWDTTIKHYARLGLLNNIPDEILTKIPRSNIHRWKNEPDDKYTGCEIAKFIGEEIELFRKGSQYKNTKKILKAYYRLSDTYNSILHPIKGIKKQLKKHKETIVETVEQIRKNIPIKNALQFFNISRATYQNYKTLVLNKCDNSYFLWCVKNYPNQLLKKEIFLIKKYMEDNNYRYWSKSSIYWIAVRNKDIGFCLTSWYKYCKLLGYKSNRHLQQKIKYKTLQSNKPNDIWCADVTILKTTDNQKHYIHFLMDHYSKKILGYKIENAPKPIAIKNILQQAYINCNTKNTISFVTDGGIENVNTTIKNFVSTFNNDIKHLIAQKDIPFSNSKIEAFNKIIKHQFLLPRNLSNKKQLEIALQQDIETYNDKRLQQNLLGNTPAEIYSGKSITKKNHCKHLQHHKQIRIATNKNNRCNSCS